MRDLIEQLVDTIDHAHTVTGELQQRHANDPRTLAFQRHLWIVRHTLNAARAALLDVTTEASRLRDLDVEI